MRVGMNEERMGGGRGERVERKRGERKIHIVQKRSGIGKTDG